VPHFLLHLLWLMFPATVSMFLGLLLRGSALSTTPDFAAHSKALPRNTFCAETNCSKATRKMTSRCLIMAQFTKWIMFLSALGVLLARPGLAHADSSLMHKAKREGQLVWYTSMNSAQAQPILDGFMSKYLFITADLLLASADRIINRVLQEAPAETWNFDVVTVSRIESLAQRNLIARYRSPESQAYLPQFRGSDGRWTAVFNDYYSRPGPTSSRYQQQAIHRTRSCKPCHSIWSVDTTSTARSFGKFSLFSR